MGHREGPVPLPACVLLLLPLLLLAAALALFPAGQPIDFASKAEGGRRSSCSCGWSFVHAIFADVSKRLMMESLPRGSGGHSRCCYKKPKPKGHSERELNLYRA